MYNNFLGNCGGNSWVIILILILLFCGCGNNNSSCDCCNNTCC